MLLTCSRFGCSLLAGGVPAALAAGRAGLSASAAPAGSAPDSGALCGGGGGGVIREVALRRYSVGERQGLVVEMMTYNTRRLNFGQHFVTTN